MLVSGSVKTDKYVSLTNLRDNVFLTPSSSFTPYTSAFKSFYQGAGSGTTKNHHLTHAQAQGYGFTFHPSSEYPAVSKSAKLCLPEEMIAMNPKILFGGVVSSGGSVGTVSTNLTLDDSIDIGFVAFVTFTDRVTVKIVSYSSYLAGGGSGNINMTGKFTSIDYSINGSTVTLAQVKSHGEIESVKWDTVNAFQHDTSTANWELDDYDFTGYGSMYLTKSSSTPSSSTRKKKWNFSKTGTAYSAEGTVVTCNDIKDFNRSGESASNFYLYLSPEPVGTLYLMQLGFQIPWYVRLEYGASNVQHPQYTATFSLLGTGSTVLYTQQVILNANLNAANGVKSVTIPNSLENTNIRFSVSISPTPSYGYTTYAEKGDSVVTSMTFGQAQNYAYTSVAKITYQSPEFTLRIQTRAGFENGNVGEYDTFHNVDVSKIDYDRSEIFSESSLFDGSMIDDDFVYGSYVDVTAKTDDVFYFTFSNAYNEGWKEVGIFDGDNTLLVEPVASDSMGYSVKFSWTVKSRPSIIYIDYDFRE